MLVMAVIAPGSCGTGGCSNGSGGKSGGYEKFWFYIALV